MLEIVVGSLKLTASSPLKIGRAPKENSASKHQFAGAMFLREPRHTPRAYYTPSILKPRNEMNSFINCCLGIWGMFLSGYVGIFLEYWNL